MSHIELAVNSEGSEIVNRNPTHVTHECPITFFKTETTVAYDYFLIMFYYNNLVQ